MSESQEEERATYGASCPKCCGGIIEWLQECGCWESRYCECLAGIEAKAETEAVADFKRWRKNRLSLS